MTIEATSAGRIFYENIASRVNRGRIYSVFHRAFNWIDDLDGSMFTVASSDIGNIPFGLLVLLEPSYSFIESGIRKNQSVLIKDSRLIIGRTTIEINLGNVFIWDNKQRSSDNLLSIATISENIWNAYIVASERIPNIGLAPLLKGCRHSLSGTLDFYDAQSELCRMGLKKIYRLWNGLKNRENGLLQTAVKDLIGFGVGLTPSGDDILVGLLGTLALMKKKDQTERCFRDVANIICENVEGRTTLVGETYLKHAANGSLSEVLEDAILAIIEDRNRTVSEKIRRLLQFGGTSGYESLLGVIVATNFACVNNVN